MRFALRMDLDATIDDLVAKIMEISQVSPENIQVYKVGFKSIFGSGRFLLKNMRENNKNPKIFDKSPANEVFFISFVENAENATLTLPGTYPVFVKLDSAD